MTELWWKLFYLSKLSVATNILSSGRLGSFEIEWRAELLLRFFWSILSWSWRVCLSNV